MHTPHPWARAAYATLGAAVLALPAAAQTHLERVPLVSQFFVNHAEPVAAAPQDERLEHVHSLLERLEVGMSALEEIGARDTLHHVQEIAQRLRREAEEIRRASSERRERGEREGHGEGPDLSKLEVRIEILHTARHACAEAGHERHVAYMGRVIEVAMLQARGAGEEELAQAMEGISMGNVIEHLVHAGQLWEDFGHEHKSHLCMLLADFYAEREGEDIHHDDEEHEHESEGEGGLDDLGNRMDVVRLARRAADRLGKQEAEHYLERWLHLGELHMSEGVTDAQLAEASQGLSSATTVRVLDHLGELLAEHGREREAHAIFDLVEFYIERDGLHEGEGEDHDEHEGDHDDDHWLQERGNRLEVVHLALKAHAEAGREDATHFLERFLHFGRLQEADATDEQLAQAAEGLSMEAAIELIGAAAELYQDWGHDERTHACAQLAEFYAWRAAGGEEGEHDGDEFDEREFDEHDEEGEHEGERMTDEQYAALQRRVHVLEMAQAAHSEAGHPDRAGMLERAVHLGVMILEGEHPERIAGAAEGFSTERLIGPLRSASELYGEWGHGERAEMCAWLANYYAEQNAGGEAEREHAEREHAERRRELVNHLEELHHRMRQLEEEMQVLRRQLEELTHAIDR